MRSLALLILIAPLTASAVPLELGHQGRLLDSTGTPLDGAEDLTFRLYGDSGDTNAAWTEVQSVTLEDGYYAVQLGSVEDLDSALFDGSTLYVGVSVGSGPELTDRLPISSVPYALVAGSVDGGSVNASSISVGGTEVINASGEIDFSSISNAPASPLDSLSCSQDQVAAFDGSAWACADPTAAHTHAADDITSGKLDITVIPVGTGSEDVAAGNHTHTAADVGALPDSGGTLSGGLSGTSAEFSGTVTVGSTSDSCSSNNAGAIQFTGGSLRVCDGSDWTEIVLAQKGITANTPGESCLDILQDNSTASDGRYWIDPDGSGGLNPWVATCDMTGGGWTQVGYTEDIEFKQWFSGGDAPRYLPENFSLAWSNEQINALRDVSTEGKQSFVGLCDGVIYYLYQGAHTNAVRFKFHTGDTTPRGIQDYSPWDISLSQDVCGQANGGENGQLSKASIFEINALELPLTNIETRDSGDNGEKFGSPLTDNPAWFR